MADFKIPEVIENGDGWGPPLDVPPERFRDMPYAPFSKSDRLGRAADLFSSQSSRASDRYGIDGYPDDDEQSFTMVDQRPSSGPFGPGGAFSSGGNRGRGGHSGYGYRGGSGGRSAQFSSNRRLMDERGEFQGRKDQRRTGFRGGARGNSRGGFRGGYQNRGGRWEDRSGQSSRELSVQVAEDWTFVAEMSHTQLSKMKCEKLVEGADVVCAGSLHFYDRAIDRVTPRNPKVLSKFPDREFHYVTTTDDPIIRRLASQNTANIFATSSIVSLLMVAPRTANGWDVVVQRIGDKLFFDKREGSMIDFLTIGETSFDVVDDKSDANSYHSLALEATSTNQDLSQTVLKAGAKPYKFEEADPFAESGVDSAPVGYRYRKWDFGEGRSVLVRCEVDAAMEGPNGPSFVAVKALNEIYDVKSEWKSRLDSNRGAVFATEIKNNAGKLARWTAQALLSDVEQIKFGFCTRSNPKDGSSHQLLATHLYKPKDFANQIALTSNNIWGVFLYMVDLCYRYMDTTGKAIFMKDPNEPIVRMYRVPEDAFDETDESDDEENTEDQDGA